MLEAEHSLTEDGCSATKYRFGGEVFTIVSVDVTLEEDLETFVEAFESPFVKFTPPKAFPGLSRRQTLQSQEWRSRRTVKHRA